MTAGAVLKRLTDILCKYNSASMPTNIIDIKECEDGQYRVFFQVDPKRKEVYDKNWY